MILKITCELHLEKVLQLLRNISDISLVDKYFAEIFRCELSWYLQLTSKWSCENNIKNIETCLEFFITATWHYKKLFKTNCQISNIFVYLKISFILTKRHFVRKKMYFILYIVILDFWNNQWRVTLSYFFYTLRINVGDLIFIFSEDIY